MHLCCCSLQGRYRSMLLESSDRCVPTPILNAKEDMSLIKSFVVVAFHKEYDNQCTVLCNHEILFEATKPLQIPTLPQGLHSVPFSLNM